MVVAAAVVVEVEVVLLLCVQASEAGRRHFIQIVRKCLRFERIDEKIPYIVLRNNLHPVMNRYLSTPAFSAVKGQEQGQTSK